jgi:hypothetical protein
MDALLRGGPADGEARQVDDVLPAVIGNPSDGGVYERTGEREADRAIYRWRQLTPAQAVALQEEQSRQP